MAYKLTQLTITQLKPLTKQILEYKSYNIDIFNSTTSKTYSYNSLKNEYNSTKENFLIYSILEQAAKVRSKKALNIF